MIYGIIKHLGYKTNYYFCMRLEYITIIRINPLEIYINR